MKFSCKKCQAQYTIADEKVRGKVIKVRCKRCNQLLVVRDQASNSLPAAIADEGDSILQDTSLEIEFEQAFKGLFSSGIQAKDAPVEQKPEPGERARGLDIGEGDEPVWFYGLDGSEEGPLTLLEMEQKIREGGITDDHFVWRDGLADWVSLEDVPELAGFLPRNAKSKALALARQRELEREREEAIRKRRSSEGRRKKEDEARDHQEERRRLEVEEKAHREAEQRQAREVEERRQREVEEAKLRLEEDHRRRLAEDQRKREEEDRRRREAEETRKREEEDRRRRGVEETRKRDEEDRKRRGVEETRKREEEDRRRREAEETRKREEEDRAQRAAEDARKREEEDHRRLEAEDRKKKEADRARQEAEERKSREQEARLLREVEEKKKILEEERRKKEAAKPPVVQAAEGKGAAASPLARDERRIAEHFFASGERISRGESVLPPPPVISAEEIAAELHRASLEEEHQQTGVDPLAVLTERDQPLKAEISRVIVAQAGVASKGRRFSLALLTVIGVLVLAGGLVALAFTQGWFSMESNDTATAGGSGRPGAGMVGDDGQPLSPEEAARLRKSLWDEKLQKKSSQQTGVVGVRPRPAGSGEEAPPVLSEKEKQLLAFYESQSEERKELAPRLPTTGLMGTGSQSAELPATGNIDPGGATLPGKGRETAPVAPSQTKNPQRLTEDQIHAVIQLHYRQVQHCLERQLKKDPGATGKMIVVVHVKPDGHVESTYIDAPKFRGTLLEECLSRALKRWQFPSFEGETYDLTFPLLLSAQQEY